VLLAAASQAAAQSGDGRPYGGNDWNQRYSRLKNDLDRQRIAADPPDDFPDRDYQAGLVREHPIVSTASCTSPPPYNTAIAYDLTTKKELWRLRAQAGHHHLLLRPQQSRHGHSRRRHVYMGTLDAHLVALGAQDGKVVWDKEVADPAFGYSITHAPLIIGDNVIVGVSGRNTASGAPSPPTNAVTGDQVWRWYSIPAPKGDSTSTTRPPTAGGAPGRLRRQTAPTCTPRRHQGERATAPSTPTPDPRRRRRVDDAGIRPRRATPSSSRLATPPPTSTAASGPATTSTPTAWWPSTRARARTKWYYQTVPHDVWDLDASRLRS